MTPAEFSMVVDGWNWRQEREQEREARHAYWIMSASLGDKTPSPDDLLGKNRREPPSFEDLERGDI